MKYYKELLLKKLSDSGWELSLQDDNIDWWLEEYWKICSIKQNWGFELYILFLVDPQYDGNNKSQAVWVVEAYDSLPSERPVDQNVIADMHMKSGKYDENLRVFLGKINDYRDSIV